MASLIFPGHRNVKALFHQLSLQESIFTELCHSRLQRPILLSQKRGDLVWRHPGLFSKDSQPKASLDESSLTDLN